MFFLFQRDVRSMGSFLGANGITDGSGMLTVMAKLLKQELASDAEEEGLVPALPGRFTSIQKVPSLSDLSDPESSLGESFEYRSRHVARPFDRAKHALRKMPLAYK